MFASWVRLAAVRQTHVGEAAEIGSAAVILRILKDHGPCNKNVIWQHAEEAGVKSKRHMKLMLRWLKERNQLHISCLNPAAAAAAASQAALPGSAAEAAAQARGAGSSAFAAAAYDAARTKAPSRSGAKKKGHKAAVVEREFVYSVAPRKALNTDGPEV